MNAIGIRQGRLSAHPARPIRDFPRHSWKEEFALARVCGFDTIEWLFAAADHDRNPVWTDQGSEEIVDQIAGSGVRVDSLCADYFIVHPFFRVPDAERKQNVAVLNRLIAMAARIEAGIVVIPVLEASEIRAASEIELLLDSLGDPLAVALAHGVRLALETELPALEFRSLVERRAHPALGICYDTGNAVARGYDIGADLNVLAPYVFGVHVKDRKRNGPSVGLGEGDVDFSGFFKAAAGTGCRGPLILEAPAGDDPVAAAMAHMAFLRRLQ